jgi:hypothetical protein
VCDRRRRDDRRAVLLALNAQDDHARAIFKPFVLAGVVLSAPKLGIGNDQARLRRRDRRHAPGLFRVDQGVEVGVSGIHARPSDRLDLFVRKFLGREAVALVPEALEFLWLLAEVQRGQGPDSGRARSLQVAQSSTAIRCTGGDAAPLFSECAVRRARH